MGIIFIYFFFAFHSCCFVQPVVSKTLVSNCKPVVDMLVKKFGERKMYQYQVERDRHQDVSFKMLSSNITQLVSHLDDVRRDPK
jgi:UDP-N-acetylglucosamine-lysosomal-enzyme